MDYRRHTITLYMYSFFLSPLQEEEHRRIVEERERELQLAAEEARRLEEEATLARERAAREGVLQEQTEDTFAAIHDLDDALKAFQGALGLSEVRKHASSTYHTVR